MIRIILVDDHNIVRNGIRNILEKSGEFEVIGEASNGRQVVDLIEKGIIPNMILADMNMPEMNGISLVESLKHLDGGPKITFLTILDNEHYVIQAFKSGVHGYLLKNIGAEELIFALTHIHNNNKKYISSDLAVRLLDRVSHLPVPDIADTVIEIGFSKRETEVLALIAEGYTNQEIADKLFTSRRTIEGHRQALMDKANVRNSAALVRFAFQNNLIY